MRVINLSLYSSPTRNVVKSGYMIRSANIDVNREYLEALHVLKSTFSGSNETDFLLRSIVNHPSSKRALTMLEVGSGDGSFLKRLLARAKILGIKLTITALDPLASAITATREVAPAARVFQTQFETAQLSQMFDIVNVRHSLYYIRQPAQQLDRMIRLLNPGGLLLVTMWSKYCDLYKAHQIISGGGNRTIVAEDVYFILKSYDGQLTRRDFLSNIDLASWKNSPSMLRSVYLVLSRDLRFVQKAKIINHFKKT